MIKLMHAEYRQEYRIFCEFSDGLAGIYDLEDLLFAFETPLTVPLRDPGNFRKFFLRSGALCWHNGLELDPEVIHAELSNSDKLAPMPRAA